MWLRIAVIATLGIINGGLGLRPAVGLVGQPVGPVRPMWEVWADKRGRIFVYKNGRDKDWNSDRKKSYYMESDNEQLRRMIVKKTVDKSLQVSDIATSFKANNEPKNDAVNENADETQNDDESQNDDENDYDDEQNENVDDDQNYDQNGNNDENRNDDENQNDDQNVNDDQNYNNEGEDQEYEEANNQIEQTHETDRSEKKSTSAVDGVDEEEDYWEVPKRIKKYITKKLKNRIQLTTKSSENGNNVNKKISNKYESDNNDRYTNTEKSNTYSNKRPVENTFKKQGRNDDQQKKRGPVTNDRIIKNNDPHIGHGAVEKKFSGTADTNNGYSDTPKNDKNDLKNYEDDQNYDNVSEENKKPNRNGPNLQKDNNNDYGNDNYGKNGPEMTNDTPKKGRNNNKNYKNPKKVFKPNYGYDESFKRPDWDVLKEPQKKDDNKPQKGEGNQYNNQKDKNDDYKYKSKKDQNNWNGQKNRDSYRPKDRDNYRQKDRDSYSNDRDRNSNKKNRYKSKNVKTGSMSFGLGTRLPRKVNQDIYERRSF